MSEAKSKLMKKLLSLASDAKKPKKKAKQTEAEKKKIGGKERKITGVGALAEPQKGHLKQVKGKKGKVMDEQKIKGLDKVDMGQFARAQARGGKKAEEKMTAMGRLQREYEGLTKKAKIAEVAKGKKSKYHSVIQKIGKGYQRGGSGTRPEKEIDPKSIRTKGQFENLLAKGRLEGLSNDKIVDIALRVGYITADEMMGNAKGGAMMKKKGMAKGGMKKKGMAMGGLKKPAAGQTGLKKLPTPVRNKMGYMKKGGMKKKSYAAGGMTVSYKVGGMAKGKMYGSVDNRKKK